MGEEELDGWRWSSSLVESGGIRLSLYLVRATCHGRHLAHVYWITGFLLWED